MGSQDMCVWVSDWNGCPPTLWGSFATRHTTGCSLSKAGPHLPAQFAGLAACSWRLWETLAASPSPASTVFFKFHHLQKPKTRWRVSGPRLGKCYKAGKEKGLSGDPPQGIAEGSSLLFSPSPASFSPLDGQDGDWSPAFQESTGWGHASAWTSRASLFSK